MANKKPAACSAAQLETHSAAKLERLSRQFGVPVGDGAVDRILATIDLAGTTVLLPGIDAGNLDKAQAAAIKRVRWGGSVRLMLSFLGAVVHLRGFSTQEARKKMARLAKEFIGTRDQGDKAALALVKMAFGLLQANVINARAWTNERIAGEYLPQQYGLFEKKPKMTRGGETVKFVQAGLRELNIFYEEESIIRAMGDAKKSKRRR